MRRKEQTLATFLLPSSCLQETWMSFLPLSSMGDPYGFLPSLFLYFLNHAWVSSYYIQTNDSKENSDSSLRGFCSASPRTTLNCYTKTHVHSWASKTPIVSPRHWYCHQKAGLTEGKNKDAGNSLVVQWLGLCAFTADGAGSIPGGGTKIPQAERHSHVVFNKIVYVKSPIMVLGRSESLKCLFSFSSHLFSKPYSNSGFYIL